MNNKYSREYSYIGDVMNIGDLVTRDSYDNDLVFTIIDIEGETCYLKGINVRLYADSSIKDLKKYEEEEDIELEREFQEKIKEETEIERDEYFYLPGKILHIDGDKDYLNRCLKYYDDMNIAALGINEKEDAVAPKIVKLLEEYKPNILVITGHDAYYKRKGNVNDIKAYKNSYNFAEAIKAARAHEDSHTKLIIIAGACQSNYEELIKAGANFASSPRRINIHALDPAIIASKMSLSDINKDIDLKGIIENTKYGSHGVGGIITKGTMYIGYPR